MPEIALSDRLQLCARCPAKSSVQSWFAGYYPEEEPRYVMAVIAEDTNNTGSKAAPVFKQICDKIYELEQSRANAS